ncbi:MAG: hypothetical protein Q8P57_04340 [Candidatus Pacearchaeota archaeon]|nr:hypothetical protein [Candidatus Pacearchaeota archaeon]
MEKDIDKIPKNSETEIIIRIDDFGGRPGLTIREFVKSERYTGFTKSGTRVPAEYFKQFKDAINSIDEKDFAVPDSKPEEKEQQKLGYNPESEPKNNSAESTPEEMEM